MASQTRDACSALGHPCGGRRSRGGWRRRGQRGPVRAGHCSPPAVPPRDRRRRARAGAGCPCACVRLTRRPRHPPSLSRPQYSDSTSDPTRPFQLGLVLDSLSFGPGDEDGTGGEATSSPGSAGGSPAGLATMGVTQTPAIAPDGTSPPPSASSSASSSASFQLSQARWSGLFVYMHSLEADSGSSRQGGRLQRATSLAAEGGGGDGAAVSARLTEVFGWTGLDVAALQLVVNDVRTEGASQRGWIHPPFLLLRSRALSRSPGTASAASRPQTTPRSSASRRTWSAWTSRWADAPPCV